MSALKLRTLTEEQVTFYQENGYYIANGMLSEEECDEIIARAEELHQQKHIPGCFSRKMEEDGVTDPLELYPRMMHPHRVDKRCEHYLTHPKIADTLRDLLQDGVTCLQSMFYWKPPHARGQAFHQDDYYLRTEPGACIAAWTALEKIDPENGGMSVFPKSHNEPILPMAPTDVTKSFTDTAVTPPVQYQVMPVIMEKGDTLFFHGHMIHGSYPNESDTRFRRVYICHYIGSNSSAYNHGYDPVIELG